ncbi:MAG: aldo/keto reductase [Chloroflexota bacterium]|nr:aldo/keto reductase [Chloroflexota bacterium]
MKYRMLGRTGLQVSELGFGAWAIGGNQPDSYDSTKDEISIQAIHKALEVGCNFFDTADVYGFGHSEELVGRGLREAGKLKEVYIASKVGGNFYNPGGKVVTDFSPKHIRFALEQTLKRLDRDYLDLYQLHNPSRPLIEDGQIFEVLDELKAEGKIRFYGVSIHSVPEGLACLRSGKPDTIQVVYNLFSLVQSENPAEQLFPQALEQNVGITIREPLANGFLTGKQRLDTTYEPGDIRSSWPSNYRSFRIRMVEALRFLERKDQNEQLTRTLSQVALRFALKEEGVSTVIVGLKTPAQVVENFGASDLPELTKEEYQRINRVFFG